MSGGIFAGVKQWEYEREGRSFLLAGFYRDASSFTAVYNAPTRSIRALFPDPDMAPVELRPGRAMVAFSALEYKDCDIGPCNEFSIAFLITFRKRQIPLLTALRPMMTGEMSAYVWQLPVTMEIARRGGVDPYGYPKFLADITCERDGSQVAGTVAAGGKE